MNSEKDFDGWVVENGGASKRGEVASIEVVALIAVIEDEDTASPRVPLPVLAELLRQHGYTVTPPAPDCCGRGCGECEDQDD